MAFQAASDRDLRRYTVAMIRALKSGAPPADRRWTQLEIAERVGVDPSRMTQILKHGDNPGRQVQEGVAAILRLSPNDFHAAARKWVLANPDDEGRSEPRVEGGDRYPNFSSAARFARDNGLDEQAIEQVRQHALKGDDMTPNDWYEEIKSAARHLRRGSAPTGTVLRDTSLTRPGSQRLKKDGK